MRQWAQKHSIILTLIPVLLVMALIFFFSAQNGEQSGGLSHGVTRWLMELFVPDMDSLPVWQQDAIWDRMELLLRKGGHLTEFAALGFFLLLHIRQIGKKKALPLQWLWAWGVGTAYAVTDELHQMAVGGRNPAITDVLIDSTGVIIGVALMCLLLRWSKKKERNVLKSSSAVV